MTRTRRRLVLLALLPLAGCSGAGFVANSLGLPVQHKVVMSKREPNELIAVDGTTCVVSRGRFDDTEISESATCMWSQERAPDVP